MLAPYDLNQCVDCPLGGKCNGSDMTGNMEGSVWKSERNFMRICECPAGYILVRYIHNVLCFGMLKWNSAEQTL